MALHLFQSSLSLISAVHLSGLIVPQDTSHHLAVRSQLAQSSAQEPNPMMLGVRVVSSLLLKRVNFSPKTESHE